MIHAGIKLIPFQQKTPQGFVAQLLSNPINVHILVYAAKQTKWKFISQWVWISDYLIVSCVK